MLVRFTPVSNPMIDVAREAEGEHGFTARQVADRIGSTTDDMLSTLDRLEEQDVCCRLDNSSADPTAETRWCLREHPLTEGRTYEVLAIEGPNYRLLSDPTTEPHCDDPVLFHSSLFEVVDSSQPAFWTCIVDVDGERHCGPPSWNEPGFLERFFDGESSARRQFWTDIHEYYPRTALERNLPAP